MKFDKHVKDLQELKVLADELIGLIEGGSVDEKIDALPPAAKINAEKQIASSLEGTQQLIESLDWYLGVIQKHTGTKTSYRDLVDETG